VQNQNFSSALERVTQARLDDALEIASHVENRIRARLAIYCYVRGHLREKGLAIAALCPMKDLAAESSPHVAENILALAMRTAERDMVQQQRRSVSLACL
jgi:hypothetical protein